MLWLLSVKFFFYTAACKSFPGEVLKGDREESAEEVENLDTNPIKKISNLCQFFNYWRNN